MSISAFEWLMKDKEAQRILREIGDRYWREFTLPFVQKQSREIERIFFPLSLRRPHTDDMMQMCVDLGVEVPESLPHFWCQIDVAKGRDRTGVYVIDYRKAFCTEVDTP